MDFLRVTGELPEQFDQAFAELKPLLGFEQNEAGIPVLVSKTEGLQVKKTSDGIRISWEKPVQLYRALSLLRMGWEQQEYTKEEFPCFDTGIMFDVSRNAVLRPSALKDFLRRMACMGMNVGMMYTEDTYEVPKEPYFGYLRGRYSMEELGELDGYAHMFGIELIPCIQTLGHLNRVLHWPVMQKYGDNGEVLLADQEETYALLERMISAASAPYRTRRIHIGMDEAHGIGLGAHMQTHGYENPHVIIKRHLERVIQITDRLGLEPMMWSDMYFRPDSPTNGYYDSGEPSKEAMESVVPGARLVYWDYYHNTEAEYTEMLRKHKKLTETPYFAGGIWTWTGPAPDYVKTLQTTVPALSACKAAGVPFVLAAAWGDNGAEANLTTALVGLQLYAEFAYTGGYDAAWLAERFLLCCEGDIQPFLRLSAFNTVPGMKSTWLRPVNASKFLLYQDPMVQLFVKDTEGLPMADHYGALAKEYQCYAAAGGRYQLLMNFYAQLALVLADKCRWHEEAIQVVVKEDKARAAVLVEALQQAGEHAKVLRKLWQKLWMVTNKPYGFEVLDGRMGAICARMDTACVRMENWIAGREEETLPELRETPLPYTLREGEILFGSYAMNEITSACKIDL